MMHYINIDKKRLCGRNNNQISPILFDAATEEPLQIQFITSNNQIVHLNPDELSGLYFAGNTKAAEPAYDLLFLSKDYTIENDILTFNYSTYTKNFLRKITKRNQEILIEIGQIALEKKTLLLRDYALANPRVYIEGSTPEDVDWSDFYTKEETQELLAQNLSDAKNYADGQDAATLASATAYTDEKISELDLDDFVTNADLQATKTELDGKIDTKQDKITSENKLPYSLISDTPAIPTKTSELTNDSGFQTANDVQNAISGKADTSALNAHTSDNTIHVTAADKTNWNGKLDASALNGYATEQYVDGQVSGKANTAYVDSELAKKQNKITADNKLDYALLSGVPKDNPALVPIEVKTALSAGVFEADFSGKAIQKYVYTDATSGTIEITYDSLSSALSGVAPTVELHIGINGNVSTIVLPASVNTISMPDSLTYNGQSANDIQYEVFVLRAEKDMNEIWQYYINHAYTYLESYIS